MIQNPGEYGLPLVEDIEYVPANPKAADSKRSAYRLISLLYALVHSGHISGGLGLLVIDSKMLSESCKKLKVTNSKMILKKLSDFGFTYENNTLSYADNTNVISALFGYMQNVELKQKAVFSLNYFLITEDLPPHKTIFASYLSGDERKFFEMFAEFMEENNCATGGAPDYHQFSFSIEYLHDSKKEKRIARCYSNFGKLLIRIKLHSSNCYDYYLENLPEYIKQVFRKEPTCRCCIKSCNAKLSRIFEGNEYIDCGYGNFFDIITYDPKDIEYYKQIILLEAKAEKTSARRKGIKV